MVKLLFLSLDRNRTFSERDCLRNSDIDLSARGKDHRYETVSAPAPAKNRRASLDEHDDLVLDVPGDTPSSVTAPLAFPVPTIITPHTMPLSQSNDKCAPFDPTSPHMQYRLKQFGFEMESDEDGECQVSSDGDCGSSSPPSSDISSSSYASSDSCLGTVDRRQEMLDLSLSKIHSINTSHVPVSLHKSVLIYNIMRSLQHDLSVEEAPMISEEDGDFEMEEEASIHMSARRLTWPSQREMFKMDTNTGTGLMTNGDSCPVTVCNEIAKSYHLLTDSAQPDNHNNQNQHNTNSDNSDKTTQNNDFDPLNHSNLVNVQLFQLFGANPTIGDQSQ